MDVYLGMVFPWAVPWVPYGFASCNGALLPISQNQPLFALLGTTYGGNGVQTFGLPNLQGRVVVGAGTSSAGGATFVPGQMAGTPSVTLLTTNLPSHTHSLAGTATITGGMQASHKAGTQSDPTGNYMANAANPAGGVFSTYIDATAAGALASMAGGGLAVGGATGLTGGNVPVPTISPYTCMYYIIATQGLYPTRA